MINKRTCAWDILEYNPSIFQSACSTIGRCASCFYNCDSKAALTWWDLHRCKASVPSRPSIAGWAGNFRSAQETWRIFIPSTTQYISTFLDFLKGCKVSVSTSNSIFICFATFSFFASPFEHHLGFGIPSRHLMVIQVAVTALWISTLLPASRRAIPQRLDQWNGS